MEASPLRKKGASAWAKPSRGKVTKIMAVADSAGLSISLLVIAGVTELSRYSRSSNTRESI